jgi:hypothetical protein
MRQKKERTTTWRALKQARIEALAEFPEVLSNTTRNRKPSPTKDLSRHGLPNARFRESPIGPVRKLSASAKW